MAFISGGYLKVCAFTSITTCGRVRAAGQRLRTLARKKGSIGGAAGRGRPIDNVCRAFDSWSCAGVPCAATTLCLLNGTEVRPSRTFRVSGAAATGDAGASLSAISRPGSPYAVDLEYCSAAPTPPALALEGGGAGTGRGAARMRAKLFLL